MSKISNIIQFLNNYNDNENENEKNNENIIKNLTCKDEVNNKIDNNKIKNSTILNINKSKCNINTFNKFRLNNSQL